MDLKHLTKQVERFVRSNSPEILAGLGISGVAGTAYLAHQVGYKVGRYAELGWDEQPFKEKALFVWKEYIPAVAMGFTTIACVVGGTRISSRRTAAMAAAYSISEHAFTEYKDKVKEKLGERKEQTIRDEVASAKIQGNPIGKDIILLGAGNVMCCELQTMRYFLCDMETLKKAENEINDRVLRCDYATLAEFFTLIGQVPSPYSQEFGWDHEGGLLNLHISAVLMDESRPCLGFDYNYLKPL